MENNANLENVVLTSSFEKSKWLRGLNFAAKRAFDICAAVLGLICLAPFFVLIAVLIKRESRGPVFYRGRRAGKCGKEFLILKFRTM